MRTATEICTRNICFGWSGDIYLMNLCILTIFRCHYQFSKNGPKLMIDLAHQLSDKSLVLCQTLLSWYHQVESWLYCSCTYNWYVSRELHPSCPLCPRKQVVVDRALKRLIMRHNSSPAHTRALSTISHKSKFGKATYITRAQYCASCNRKTLNN